VSDQIKEIAYQAGRKIKAAFSEFGENVRSFAEAVSGRIRTWTDVRQSRLRKTSVQRVNAAEQQETANISQIIDQRKKKKIRPIRRRNRQRVYRLLGYTTVSKINSRRKSEKRQRLLRQVLLFLIIIFVIILLFHLYNPIRDLAEWYRIIGIKDIKEIAGSQTSISPTPTVTPTITPTISASPGVTAN
jgi:Fe2+ transport system protein B